MAGEKISIVWFKRDLRIADHAPLWAAIKSGYPILPIYIIEPDYWAQDSSSQRHWQFIRTCVLELQEQLTTCGQPLIIRVGTCTQIFEELFQTYQVKGLYAHQETGTNWTYARDKAVAQLCGDSQVNLQEFPSNGVVRGLSDRDKWGAIRAKRMKQAPLPAPDTISAVSAYQSDPIPGEEDPIYIHKSVGQTQKGGRASALRLLSAFLHDKADRYLMHISKPDKAALFSSRLSAHLAFGTLSEREVYHAIEQYLQTNQNLLTPSKRKGCRAVLTRLSWRSHFIQKLEDQPEIETQTMHPLYEEMRPSMPDTNLLTAWAEGQTGYPIMDASMRCVRQTGWLPFRMRAMVVSFASYHLWLDWRHTAPILARYFTDFEPGIHYSQFQMQSGVTGINTLRIYNPVKQSYDQDKDGQFIRKYVAELAGVPTQWIHEPYRMSADLAKRYGVCIGTSYPYPIVDNRASIRQAKTKIAEYKRHPEFERIAASIYHKLGSRNRPAGRSAGALKDPSATRQLSLF